MIQFDEHIFHIGLKPPTRLPFPVFRQGPVNSHFSWPKLLTFFVCQARRRFRSWSHWVGFGRGRASGSEKSEFAKHDRLPIELTSYAGSMVWFLQRVVSYFWRTLQWCQLRWMTKLRFAFKTLPFFCFFAFFGSVQITWGDTNLGIQFLHVDTSGRLLHHQRKEAAGFKAR